MFNCGRFSVGQQALQLPSGDIGIELHGLPAGAGKGNVHVHGIRYTSKVTVLLESGNGLKILQREVAPQLKGHVAIGILGGPLLGPLNGRL